MAGSKTFYDVLGVKRDASKSDIQKKMPITSAFVTIL